jgi:hypothetical protein
VYFLRDEASMGSIFFFQNFQFYTVTYLESCDYRRGMDSWIDLLTIYTHHSELQVIKTLSLSAVPLSAVPWQRLLSVDILQLHALRFHLCSLPCRTELSTDNWQIITAMLTAISHLLILSIQLEFKLTRSPQLSSRKLGTDHIENTSVSIIVVELL